MNGLYTTVLDTSLIRPSFLVLPEVPFFPHTRLSADPDGSFKALQTLVQSVKPFEVALMIVNYKYKHEIYRNIFECFSLHTYKYLTSIFN